MKVARIESVRVNLDGKEYVRIGNRWYERDGFGFSPLPTLIADQVAAEFKRWEQGGEY